MPDGLVFESEDGTESPEFRYTNSVTRGIPSLPANVYIRNVYTDKTWVGFVLPSSSGAQTYPEDVYISPPLYAESGLPMSDETGWGKSFPVTIPPGERVRFKARVIPTVTPRNSTGSASLTTYGEWQVF